MRSKLHNNNNNKKFKAILIFLLIIHLIHQLLIHKTIKIKKDLHLKKINQMINLKPYKNFNSNK
jgi:hypothetical protein